MFDGVTVRVWILIAIAVTGYAPALYLARYIAKSPSRRDITLPSEDLTWRTPAHFYRALATLVVLASLAAFIFTPEAAEFAQSALFWPVLAACMGLWAFITVAQAIATGKIAPLVRGISTTYGRVAQPKRFWASLVWNAVLGCVSVWIAFGIFGQTTQDRCYDDGAVYSPEDSVSACSTLVNMWNAKPKDRANALAARGAAYYRLLDYREAGSDFDAAIRLNPSDAESYYHRGLAYQRLGDDHRAIADFTAAIRLQPNSSNVYYDRGFSYEHIGELERTIGDYTEVIRLEPNRAQAYFLRGEKYKALGKNAQAASDFAVAVRLDPKLTKAVYGPDE